MERKEGVAPLKPRKTKGNPINKEGVAPLKPRKTKGCNPVNKEGAEGYITNPYDWKQHLNLNMTQIKSVIPKTLKIINRLFKRVTGEPFSYPSSSDLIWIATKKTSKKKILGVCMLSTYSPNKHFNNERNLINIPYLYNFVIDTKDTNTKVLKVSVSLMMRLKIDLMQNIDIWKWLNPNDPCKPKHINLDVSIESGHAESFYIKNGFKGDEIFTAFNGNNQIEFRMLSFDFQGRNLQRGSAPLHPRFATNNL